MASAGDITITVERAIEELAAMPAEQARAVLEYAVNIIAPQPVDLSLPMPAGTVTVVGEGRVTVEAHATAMATQDAVYVPPQASVWRALLTLDSKDVRDIRNKVIGGVLLALALQQFGPAPKPRSDSPSALGPMNPPAQVDPRAAPPHPPLPQPSNKAAVAHPSPSTKNASENARPGVPRTTNKKSRTQ